MGLKNRGKKLERKEKSKVKLKAKKLLPKGQNVTDVSFKVKKIVVREQLRAVDQAEPLTRRKLNVKELLSRLQHYNTTVRQDGLSGLKELVTNYPTDALLPHLSALIEGVTALILDQETLVRRDSLKLLRSILTQVSCEQIAPFFDILQSYLSCAMTHIHTVTQEDSLLLLDVLLETTPSLVAENSQKILPNFLDMISKLRTESQPGRTLTVNLGSKLTSVKWRIKVLTRLHGLLAALVASKSEVNARSVVNETQTYRWNTEKALYCPLYYGNLVKNCELPILFGNAGKGLETTGAELQGYMNVLMPLLFETWLEVAPSSVSKEDNVPANVLTTESAELLGCIIEIIQLSWEYLQCWEQETKVLSLTTWFKATYDAEIRKYLLPGFPYSRTLTTKGGERKRKKHQDDSELLVPQGTQICTQQNLAMCHVLCCLHDVAEKHVCKRILKYTIRCVKSWKQLDPDSTNQLLKVLRSILLNRSKQWSTRRVDVAGLMTALLTCYCNATATQLRQGLFDLLGDVVLDPTLTHLHECCGFEAWHGELAELLCESQVSVKTVKVLTRLACHNDQPFLNSFLEKLPQILRNLPSLEVTGAETSADGRDSVANLIYWVAHKPNVKEILAEESKHWDNLLKNYVDQVVSLRS